MLEGLLHTGVMTSGGRQASAGCWKRPHFLAMEASPLDHLSVLTTWPSLCSEQVTQERAQRSHSVLSDLVLEITHCHFRMSPVDCSAQSIDRWEVGITSEYLEAATTEPANISYISNVISNVLSCIIIMCVLSYPLY